MPLTVFKKRRSEIVAKIAEILRSSDTTVGFADRDGLQASFAGLRIASTLNAPEFTPRLDDGRLASFLADEVTVSVRSAVRPSGMRAPLTDYAPFHDPTAAAETLLDNLLTLPWRYELLSHSPFHGTPQDHTFMLSSTFGLKMFSESSAAQYPVQAVDAVDADMSDRAYPECVEVGRYYFCATHEGYISSEDPSQELAELIDVMIGLCGLLVCDNAAGHQFLTHERLPRATPVLLYRVDRARELVGYHWLSPEQTAAFRLRHAERFKGDTFEGAIDGVKRAFEHTSTRGAARWYLESFVGSNGLMRVIKATIALEILLGDRKESRQLALTSLIANRLAYLIGSSPTERERITQHFKDLYDLRSDIVHAGVTTLGGAEQEALRDSQTYARRAIGMQIAQLRR